MKLQDAVISAQKRLDDEDAITWKSAEIALYVKDGYDLYCRRTRILFDIHIVENVPQAGNWTTDLERYLAEQSPGMGLTDERLNFTAEDERDRGVGGAVGGSTEGPVRSTSPSESIYYDHFALPVGVAISRLPNSTVDVQRVTWDDVEMLPEEPAMLRRQDSQYERREGGDPRYYTFGKDGLLVLRLVPSGRGDAEYAIVNGSWGTMTQASAIGMARSSWRLEEASGNRIDEFGLNDLLPSANPPTQVIGKIGFANGFVRANSQFLSILDTAQVGLNPGIKDFSISCWIYPTTVTGGISYAIIGKGMTDVVGIRTTGYSIFLNGSLAGSTVGTVHVDFGGPPAGGGPPAIGLYFTFAFIPLINAWSHLVLTFDRDGVCTGYFNGVRGLPYPGYEGLDGMNRLADTTGDCQPTASFCIGTNSHNDVGPGAQYFDGRIDAVEFFSEVLTQAQVDVLWFNGVGREMFSFSPTVSGSFGILREVEGAFPAGGPHGTPTRQHPDAKNIKVEVARLGRSLDHYEFEIPIMAVKYVIFWAMHRALKRDGDGQDLKFAQHYADRFEMGIVRAQNRLRKIEKELILKMGMGQMNRESFGLGDPQLPYPYGPATGRRIE